LTEIVCLRNSILLVVYYEEIKRELKRILIHGVGVMRDYNLKLRDLHVSNTLGCVGDWNT
jgi:hypothetical protein